VSYDHMLLFNRITLTLQGNPCCSLRALSRELQVSRRTIQNAVNAVTGKKFRDVREELLLVKIQNLLASAPNTTLSHVSLEAGYRSRRSFARAVRRACGVSPHQLRTLIADELLACKI
jgi:AraC-like DNA-binding protein